MCPRTTRPQVADDAGRVPAAALPALRGAQPPRVAALPRLRPGHGRGARVAPLHRRRRRHHHDADFPEPAARAPAAARRREQEHVLLLARAAAARCVGGRGAGHPGARGCGQPPVVRGAQRQPGVLQPRPEAHRARQAPSAPPGALRLQPAQGEGARVRSRRGFPALCTSRGNESSTPRPQGAGCFVLDRPLQLLVTAGRDAVVRLWNPLVPSQPQAALQGHKHPVLDVAVLSRSQLVVSMDLRGVSASRWPGPHPSPSTLTWPPFADAQGVARNGARTAAVGGAALLVPAGAGPPHRARRQGPVPRPARQVRQVAVLLW